MARNVTAEQRDAPIIERVRTHRLHLPMRGPLRWGRTSELKQLEIVLVRVDAGNGMWGVSEAPVRTTIYGETASGIEGAVREVLAPRLVGAALDDDGALRRAIASLPFNFTARAALEVAVRDARARRDGTTLVARHRGGRERVRVSAILGLDAPAAVAERAVAMAEAGVRVFKLKVGSNPRRDGAVIAAVQEALAGTDASLYADANEAYTPDEAPDRLRELADAGLLWVEEPLPVHMVRERIALKRAGILPIIADDSCFSLRDLKRELALDSFDVLNVKPARSGLGASREMLALARAHGKGVMVGSQAGSGLGTLLAAAVASRDEVDHPSELSFPLRLERDTTGHEWRYRDGWLAMDELLGAVPHPDIERAFGTDRARAPDG